ncbi:hypothetical protein LMJ96_17025, partial [Escherichia coli]|nr:hypothetical protein [Escherichia coli]
LKETTCWVERTIQMVNYCLISLALTVNDETMQEINTLLIALDKTWDDDLLPLCSQIFRRDIRASSELTQAEAVKALGFLKQKATEQKVAA